MCFVDLKKAFDNFDLWNILNILLESDVPNGIILLIIDIYSNYFSQIRIQSGLTNSEGSCREYHLANSFSILLRNPAVATL